MLTWVERLAYAKNKDGCRFDEEELAARMKKWKEAQLMESMAQDLGGVSLSTEDLQVQPKRKSLEERRAAAEDEEQRHPLAYIPSGITWLGMEAKLHRFLRGSGLGEEQIACQLMKQCVEAGSSTLMLRSRLRATSKVYNPHQFAVTILAEIKSQLNSQGAKIYNEWCVLAREREKLRIQGNQSNVARPTVLKTSRDAHTLCNRRLLDHEFEASAIHQQLESIKIE